MGAILSNVNYADSADATITENTGTFLTPLSQLQVPWGRGLCRAHDGPYPRCIFDVDLGDVKSIVTLGLKGMQGHCEVRYQLSAFADFSVMVANTVVEYESAWGFPYGAGCWLHPAGAAWEARYLRVRVDVFEGIDPSWVDMRRLWVGGGIILSDGVAAGWEVDPAVDGSPTDRSPDGDVYADARARWRRLRAGRTLMTRATAVGGTVPGLAAAIASIGHSRECVVAVRANDGGDNDLARFYETVHGQLASWAPLRSQKGDRIGLEHLMVEEVPMEPLS